LFLFDESGGGDASDHSQHVIETGIRAASPAA
jgi:hypothetical protein